MNKPMMQCGHSANATDEKGNPCCVICLGIDSGATIVDPNPPNLSNRIARCFYNKTCHSQNPSSPGLAFFMVHPDKDFDEYYCGCRGWN